MSLQAYGELQTLEQRLKGPVFFLLGSAGVSADDDSTVDDSAYEDSADDQSACEGSADGNPELPGQKDALQAKPGSLYAKLCGQESCSSRSQLVGEVQAWHGTVIALIQEKVGEAARMGSTATSPHPHIYEHVDAHAL